MWKDIEKELPDEFYDLYVVYIDNDEILKNKATIKIDSQFKVKRFYTNTFIDNIVFWCYESEYLKIIEIPDFNKNLYLKEPYYETIDDDEYYFVYDYYDRKYAKNIKYNSIDVEIFKFKTKYELLKQKAENINNTLHKYEQIFSYHSRLIKGEINKEEFNNIKTILLQDVREDLV